MVKQKKKRTKRYSGVDAATRKPSITKITAANRSKPSQWLFERRRLLKPIGILFLIGLILAMILSGVFRLF